MTDRMKSRSSRVFGVLILAAAIGTVTVAGGSALADEAEPVDIRILTVSDWHAQLVPLFVFGQGTFGGAVELSAYFDAERAGNPNSLHDRHRQRRQRAGRLLPVRRRQPREP